MDSPRLQPHLFARLLPFAFAGVGAPTRARPGRPISFTPSRPGPAAPPPWAARAPEPSPSTSSRVARLAVTLLVTVGWAIFAAWWWVVLHRESFAALSYALEILVAIVATAVVGTALWTRHNLRLARRGTRGRSSLYIPMIFTHDTLGRPVTLPEARLARAAAEVRVVMENGVKVYVVERGGRA